jgi:predicted porin
MFVGTLGDYNGIFGSAGVVQSNPSSLFDLRTGNTIAYLSPNFSGFDIKAAYVIGGETASSGQDGSDAWSVSGTYSNGPLFVTAAYETHNNTATSSACNTGAVCLGAASVGPDQDSWKVGIGYTIGDLKLGAAYESMSLDKQNAVIYGTTYSGVDGSHDAWLVNASYKIGAFTLKGEYVTADDLDNVNNSGADMWAVGVDYTMSKRTKLQLTYADMNNDSVGGWALGQGAQVVPHTTGEDVNGISLGIVHSF